MDRDFARSASARALRPCMRRRSRRSEGRLKWRSWKGACAGTAKRYEALCLRGGGGNNSLQFKACCRGSVRGALGAGTRRRWGG